MNTGIKTLDFIPNNYPEPLPYPGPEYRAPRINPKTNPKCRP
jgi:hypothetical protein